MIVEREWLGIVSDGGRLKARGSEDQEIEPGIDVAVLDEEDWSVREPGPPLLRAAVYSVVAEGSLAISDSRCSRLPRTMPALG